MKHAYFLSPSGQDAGLTTVSLGVGRALQRRGVSVAFFKPIAQPHPDDDERERSDVYAEVALNQRRFESMKEVRGDFEFPVLRIFLNNGYTLKLHDVFNKYAIVQQVKLAARHDRLCA